MLYQKQLETRYEVDVLVVGGGASGVTAAVAAARQGKKVLLVEAGGCFGGVGTSGMVPSFAPFWDGENMLCSGIGLEIRKNVSKHVPLEQYWTPVDPEALKREYDRILEEAGVKFVFFTTLCDVVASGDHIEYALFTSQGGMFAVKAKIYVDCTGDGSLIALAGGKYEVGDENGNVMPPTLCSSWGGIDVERYNAGIVEAKLEDAFRDKVFTFEDRHLSGFGVRPGGYAGGNIGHIFDTDPLDPESVTAAMVWGRKSMLEYIRFYNNYVPGCEKATLVGTGSILGVRESRRIVCDYMLNVNDFRARASFDDEVGRYNYPVDIHIMNTDPEELKRFEEEYATMRYKKGESYGIPLRSLIPASFSNVFVSGRCMGTDRQMEASIRVQPGCYIVGQAAGTAAALAVDKQDARSVDAQVLQRELLKGGAWLRKELR